MREDLNRLLSDKRMMWKRFAWRAAWGCLWTVLLLALSMIAVLWVNR